MQKKIKPFLKFVENIKISVETINNYNILAFKSGNTKRIIVVLSRGYILISRS